MIVFTDAGTSKNGQKGFQKTRICIFDSKNKLLLDEYIGDYSNNEGELAAIGRALQIEKVKEIKTDSQTAKGWVTKGWTKSKEKLLSKGKLTLRHKAMITKANYLWTTAGLPKITWIGRELNLAGHYLEEKYGI
jgi:ribonuclease HI